MAPAGAATAAGGVAFLGGNASLSRRVDDRFGVVEVGDYPAVRVYNDNEVMY